MKKIILALLFVFLFSGSGCIVNINLRDHHGYPYAYHYYNYRWDCWVAGYYEKRWTPNHVYDNYGRHETGHFAYVWVPGHYRCRQ